MGNCYKSDDGVLLVLSFLLIDGCGTTIATTGPEVPAMFVTWFDTENLWWSLFFFFLSGDLMNLTYIPAYTTTGLGAQDRSAAWTTPPPAAASSTRPADSWYAHARSTWELRPFYIPTYSDLTAGQAITCAQGERYSLKQQVLNFNSSTQRNLTQYL